MAKRPLGSWAWPLCDLNNQLLPCTPRHCDVAYHRHEEGIVAADQSQFGLMPEKAFPAGQGGRPTTASKRIRPRSTRSVQHQHGLYLLSVIYPASVIKSSADLDGHLSLYGMLYRRGWHDFSENTTETLLTDLQTFVQILIRIAYLRSYCFIWRTGISASSYMCSRGFSTTSFVLCILGSPNRTDHPEFTLSKVCMFSTKVSIQPCLSWSRDGRI